jgi:hypothetical protein
VTIEVVEGW